MWSFIKLLCSFVFVLIGPVSSRHDFSTGPLYAKWTSNVNGQPSVYEYDGSEMIHEVFPKLCAQRGKDVDSCSHFMDTMAFHVTDLYYTPTRSTSQPEDYFAVHQDIVLHALSFYNNPSYLEIGCSKDENFRQVLNAGVEYAICVDPVEGGTHRMTSDDFFLQNDKQFDVIFVDGLHTGEQAYIDVLNALAFLKPNGTIIIHDCNPRSEIIQGPQGAFPFWSGDVWRAAVALRLMEGIEIVIGDFDFGVGVIRRRPNTHKLPIDWIIKLAVDPIFSLSYDEFAGNRELLVRLMTLQELKTWMHEWYN